MYINIAAVWFKSCTVLYVCSIQNDNYILCSASGSYSKLCEQCVSGCANFIDIFNQCTVLLCIVYLLIRHKKKKTLFFVLFNLLLNLLLHPCKFYHLILIIRYVLFSMAVVFSFNFFIIILFLEICMQ